MRIAVLWLAGAAAIGLLGCDSGKSAGGYDGAAGGDGPPGAGGTKIKIAMIPKKIGLSYFDACKAGGEEAAKELGDVDFTFLGPTVDKSEEQSRILSSLMVQEYNAVTVACNDADQIAPAMRRAREQGTHVLTYDADANPKTSQREFFINQCTVESIARALVDEMVAQTAPDAEVAILSSTPTAPNQVTWLRAMEAYRESKYPNLRVLPTKYGEEDQQLGITQAKSILNGYPNVRGIWGMSSVAFPAAAEAVKTLGKTGQVAVVGLSLPRDMARYVKDGIVKTVILWNPKDLGYLTVYAARAAVKGELKEGSTSLEAGRLKQKPVNGQEIVLGEPLRFTRENIDNPGF